MHGHVNVRICMSSVNLFASFASHSINLIIIDDEQFHCFLGYVAFTNQTLVVKGLTSISISGCAFVDIQP